MVTLVPRSKRHRGTYKPCHQSPYELSRSRIDNFIRCPACFYLKQVKGVEFPSIPGFNLNEATDILFKRDFDKYRGGQTTHPYLVAQGYPHLVPFEHENFEMWTQSLHFGAEGRFNTIHEPKNLKVGGGIDDVWKNIETNQLHIVDYKSTSQKSMGKVITLDDKWKAAYKRQMDLYVWIMREKGFDVGEVGYFLYCDGDRFSDYVFLSNSDAQMKFNITLIPYRVDFTWIEPTLFAIKKCLDQDVCPEHDSDCEYGEFLSHVYGMWT